MWSNCTINPHFLLLFEAQMLDFLINLPDYVAAQKQKNKKIHSVVALGSTSKNLNKKTNFLWAKSGAGDNSFCRNNGLNFGKQQTSVILPLMWNTDHKQSQLWSYLFTVINPIFHNSFENSTFMLKDTSFCTFYQTCRVQKGSKRTFSLTLKQLKHTGAIFIMFAVTIPFEGQLFQVTPPSSAPS